MAKRCAIAVKPVCSADNSTARSAAVNTTRMKNFFVSVSSNCWASRMFWPLWARKVETAATMPGRSGQDKVRTNWLWGIDQDLGRIFGQDIWAAGWRNLRPALSPPEPLRQSRNGDQNDKSGTSTEEARSWLTG